MHGFGASRDPWLLTRPTLTLERVFSSGARVTFGLGLITAACLESISTLGKRRGESLMGGVWNTAGAGAAIPLSSRTNLFGELSLIMRGVVPAKSWIGVTPVVGVLGITTDF